MVLNFQVSVQECAPLNGSTERSGSREVEGGKFRCFRRASRQFDYKAEPTRPDDCLRTRTHLRFVQGVDQNFIVQDVALGVEEQLQDPVLDGLELVLVRVDAHHQLVPLVLQVWPLQADHVTEEPGRSSYTAIAKGREGGSGQGGGKEREREEGAEGRIKRRDGGRGGKGKPRNVCAIGRSAGNLRAHRNLGRHERAPNKRKRAEKKQRIGCSPEQLILQARLGDGEVDDRHLDAHFRQVVRVGHFSRHVKPAGQAISTRTGEPNGATVQTLVCRKQ